MSSRKPRKVKPAPDTVLSVLLRIEQLLKAPRTIEDRMTDAFARVRAAGFAWRRHNERGSATYTLIRGVDSGEAEQVLIGVFDNGWQHDGKWHAAIDIQHALIDATDAFLGSL